MKKTPTTARHTIELEGMRLPIVIRRHPSSRRIIIRYQPLRRCVSLTLPRYTPLKQGLHFVEEKRGWIAERLREHAGGAAFADGVEVPVLGERYVIRHVGGRGVVRIENGQILVPGDADFLPRRLRDWVVRLAREEIGRLVAAKAAQLGRAVGKIGVRDTHSHWGSCNHAGNLSFSWRLVFAPYEVLEYVVSHEVAHLVELNHSPAFWRKVGELCPNWQEPREWIKANGQTLYAYR